jgi:hypothetical protein
LRRPGAGPWRVGHRGRVPAAGGRADPPDPGRRAGRALEAAHARPAAGASSTALELLAVAAAGPLDVRQGARIVFDRTRGSEVPGMLLEAARTLAPLDPAQSREAYLHALDAAIVTGGLGDGCGGSAVPGPRPHHPHRRGPPTSCSSRCRRG